MRHALRRLRGDRRGIAAVEFAILLPVLLLIVALLADLGFAYHLRLLLTKGVAAGTYYASSQGGALSSANEASLAQNVVALVKGIAGSGVTVTVLANGVAGTANADTFYCLTGMIGTGSSSAPCPDATTSGKFVTVRGSLSYVPIFPVITAKIVNLAIGETVTVRVE